MAAALRPRQSTDQVGFATRTALSMLGRRALALDAEKEGLDEMLERLVEKTAPELLGRLGVGVDTAATLLVTAGDNPGRTRSEAAWAHLCGVAPHPGVIGQGDPCAPRPRRRPSGQFSFVGHSHGRGCRPTKPPGLTWSAAWPRGAASSRWSGC